MTFKPRRPSALYIPPRASQQERQWRQMAAAIDTQDKLECVLAQVGPNRTDQQRREIQERAFTRLAGMVKFRAKRPAFLPQPESTQ